MPTTGEPIMPVLQFNLGERIYDWYDFTRIDESTFKSKDGLTVHCNLDAHEDYDRSYVRLDGLTFTPQECGMSDFQIWQLVKDLNYVFDKVDQEKALEKLKGLKHHD